MPPQPNPQLATLPVYQPGRPIEEVIVLRLSPLALARSRQLRYGTGVPVRFARNVDMAGAARSPGAAGLRRLLGSIERVLPRATHTQNGRGSRRRWHALVQLGEVNGGFLGDALPRSFS